MVSVRTSLTATAGAALVVLGTVSSAQAATATFNTSASRFTPGVDNQGAWSTTFSNVDTNDSYLVGRNVRGDIFRNFFTFDVSSLREQLDASINERVDVTSATLVLTRYRGFGSRTQTITLFDVSTPAATLNRNVGTSTSIFNDLGTGDSYGSFNVSTTGSNSGLLLFNLNSDAWTDIELAAGNSGFFSIGGRLDFTSPGQQGLFSGSSDLGVQRLVITAETVPEPSSVMGVLGFGAFGLGWMLKRRQKNQKKASSV